MNTSNYDVGMPPQIIVVSTDEARGYLEEIASELAMLFDLELKEAVGRVNRSFEGRQFLTAV